MLCAPFTVKSRSDQAGYVLLPVLLSHTLALRGLLLCLLCGCVCFHSRKNSLCDTQVKPQGLAKGDLSGPRTGTFVPVITHNEACYCDYLCERQPYKSRKPRPRTTNPPRYSSYCAKGGGVPFLILYLLFIHIRYNTTMISNSVFLSPCACLAVPFKLNCCVTMSLLSAHVQVVNVFAQCFISASLANLFA